MAFMLKIITYDNVPNCKIVQIAMFLRNTTADEIANFRESPGKTVVIYAYVRLPVIATHNAQPMKALIP